MINLAKFFLRKARAFLPMFIIRFIIDLYFNRYYVKSYSQYGEDLIILNFFKKLFYSKLK